MAETLEKSVKVYDAHMRLVKKLEKQGVRVFGSVYGLLVSGLNVASSLRY